MTKAKGNALQDVEGIAAAFSESVDVDFKRLRLSCSIFCASFLIWQNPLADFANGFLLGSI